MKKRRDILTLVGLAATGAAAGCLSSDDDENEGEPIDSNEPEATDTPTPTPDPTETPTPTETDTPESVEPANRLEVTDDYWSEASHITAYSAGSVEVTVRDDLDVEHDDYRIFAALYTYPRDELLTYNASEGFSSSSLPTDVSISFDASQLPEGQRLHYSALVGRDAELGDHSAEELASVAETDPFEHNGGRIERSPHPEAVGSESGDRYERRDVEGAYVIDVSGRTQGSDWTAGIQIWKAAYVSRATEPRGRSRPEYVSWEMTEGTAGSVAQILADEAEENGFTGKQEKSEFVVDYVQALPYVPDDVSTDFDDYTKFIAETIAEGGGDCEDMAILMASVLQSEPFGYDMVLLQPPGHMAVGVYGKDLPGAHVTHDGRDYYYIETTGEGWGVGDLPDQYQNEQVQIYDV